MRRPKHIVVSLAVCSATFVCLFAGQTAKPASAASLTVSADFATPVDYPLSKTKFGLYNSCITPISRYNRDINLINDLHPASLRIDGAIGPGVGSGSYDAANGTACTSPEGSGIAPAPVTGTIGNIQYDFSQLDQFATLLNQRNVLPILSYSYEPWPLQNNGDWKSPPTDLNAWQGVLQTVAAHFRQTGDPIGYHEIYNEPNIINFFDGSETDYHNMYQYGAAGLRAGDPDALVAGPALSDAGSTSSQIPYLTDFLNYVSQNQLPSDVISVHQYPPNDTSEPATVLQYLGNVKSALANLSQPSYFYTDDLDLNEYNTFHISYQQGGIQDTYLAASRLLNDFYYFLSQPYLTQVNWTTFQDIVSDPSGQHPGLVSFDGHRKAIYNAYRIYADLPADRRQVTINGSTDVYDNVYGVASTDSHKAGLVLWNLSGADQTLSVALNNIGFPQGNLRVFPIDANHASWGDNPTNEFLLPSETHLGVNTAGLSWSGTLPNNGVVYLEVDDGTGLSDLQPNPLAKVIRVWHYYNNRNTTAYADFDRNTWIARLGMAAEQWQDEEIGVTAEQLPTTLNVQSQVDGTLTHEDVNSCACFRIDYADASGAYIKGVLFHGPYNGGTDLYDPGRYVGVSWGTKRLPDQVVQVSNLAAFTFNPSDYAPAGWSGRATITFILQNAGIGTRIKMSLQAGLAGHWTFDDGNGSTATDTSGYGNNGTVNGATWTQGVINKALSFNGTSDYVTMGNPGALNFGTNSFSVAAWFKTTAGGFNRIVSKGDWGWTPGYWMSVGHGGDGHVATGLGGGTQGTSILFWTNNTFNDGQWHHAVAVYDRTAGTAMLYVDGVAQNVAVAGGTCGTASGTSVNIAACTSATATSGNDPFDVGSHDGAYEFFNGAIDDVRVYNRALTAQQIEDIMAGNG